MRESTKKTKSVDGKTEETDGYEENESRHGIFLQEYVAFEEKERIKRIEKRRGAAIEDCAARI